MTPQYCPLSPQTYHYHVTRWTGFVLKRFFTWIFSKSWSRFNLTGSSRPILSPVWEALLIRCPSVLLNFQLLKICQTRLHFPCRWRPLDLNWTLHCLFSWLLPSLKTLLSIPHVLIPPSFLMIHTAPTSIHSSLKCYSSDPGLSSFLVWDTSEQKNDFLGYRTGVRPIIMYQDAVHVRVTFLAKFSWSNRSPTALLRIVK